jgi:hypothetical protein
MDWLSFSGSAIAVVASGISLWQTVLKRPILHIYTGDNISFVGDNEAGHAIAIPLTILNAGARDGVVLSFNLVARDVGTGWVKHFRSSYVAGTDFYSSPSRSKMAISPIAVPGRFFYAATLLFYPTNWDEHFEDTYEAALDVTIEPVIAPPSDWLDRLLRAAPRPFTLQLQYKNNDVMYHMKTGELRPLKIRAH